MPLQEFRVPFDPNAGLRRKAERLALQKGVQQLTQEEDFRNRVYAYQDAKKSVKPRTFEEVQALREQFGFGASQGWPQELEPGFYPRGSKVTGTIVSNEGISRTRRQAKAEGRPISREQAKELIKGGFSPSRRFRTRYVRDIPSPGESNLALDIGRREARRGRTIRGERLLEQALKTGGVDLPRKEEGLLPYSEASVRARRRRLRGFSFGEKGRELPITAEESKVKLAELRGQVKILTGQEKERKTLRKKVKNLIDFAISKSRTLGDYAIDTRGEIEKYLSKLYPDQVGLILSDPQIQRFIEKGVTPGAVDTSSPAYRGKKDYSRRIERLEDVAVKLGIDIPELYRGQIDRRGEWLGTPQSQISILQEAIGEAQKGKAVEIEKKPTRTAADRRIIGMIRRLKAVNAITEDIKNAVRFEGEEPEKYREEIYR